MAATTSGALKALIESLGLGLAAYRDDAPEGQAKPYATIREQIAVLPDESGTPWDSPGVRETAQVDLWQQWRDPATQAVTESYSLPRALMLGLHGATLNGHPQHTYGLIARSMLRLPEEENNIVHHAITVELVRDL